MNLADQCYNNIEIHLYDSLREYHYQYLKESGRVSSDTIPFAEALKEGDRWIKDNQKSLEKYKDKITLYRYEDLRKIAPELYEASKKHIKEMAFNDKNLLTAIFKDQSFHWQTRFERGQEQEEHPTKLSLKSSFNFLVDELAIFNVLGLKNCKGVNGYYCGKNLESLKYFNNIEPIQNLEGLRFYQEESLLPLLTTVFNQDATPDQKYDGYITKPELPKPMVKPSNAIGVVPELLPQPTI
jgi:hypothetical protein